MTKVIRCGWLFDGTGADPVQGAALIVENGVVKDVVAAGGQVPRDAETVDLSGLYVIPGLIDAHTHLSIIPGKGNQLGQLREPPGKQALRVAGNLKKDLDAGVTTIRVMGERIGSTSTPNRPSQRVTSRGRDSPSPPGAWRRATATARAAPGSTGRTSCAARRARI
jgi:imidazolonepropionase-like amidohydrolase